jgi:hypothetical protein
MGVMFHSFWNTDNGQESRIPVIMSVTRRRQNRLRTIQIFNFSVAFPARPKLCSIFEMMRLYSN